MSLEQVELFSARQAAIASFVGGIFGSGFVISFNLRTANRPRIAWAILCISFVFGSICVVGEWGFVQTYGLPSLLLVATWRVLLSLLTAAIVGWLHQVNVLDVHADHAETICDKTWPDLIMTGIACVSFQIVGAMALIVVMVFVALPD